MMNGASTLEGYVPDIDATVVTRILDAGGTIVGKAHCEYFCLSGGSHTSADRPGAQSAQDGLLGRRLVVGQRGAGGAGEVDMAIGGDQGGSIRMPASFCGIYGMKPTHGLVPYTGIMPIEIYVDHTGPMTATSPTTRCCSRSSPAPTATTRARYNVKMHPYTKMLEGGVKGMKIGVVKEGFAAGQCRGRREREGDGGGQAFRAAGRHGERGLDPDAPRRAGAVDADRHRGHDPDHDVGRRLWRQPAGPLRHQPDGLPPHWRTPRQRAVGDHQALHPVRHLHQQVSTAAATTARR